MKLSYVISTQPTQFQAVTLAADLDSTFARLAQLGYDGVELAVRDPAKLDLPTVKRSLEAHHLLVPAIGTGQAFVEDKLSFTDPDESVRERAVTRFESHIALARELGSLVILGLIRGNGGAQSRELLLRTLQRVARTARSSNVHLAIEPINRYETDLLNTVSDTLDLIEGVGADNVGILFDTFHANIEEPHMEMSLKTCRQRLFHVHLADSNRWAPGFGHTDFTPIVSTLREMSYDGWLSAEILQKPNPPSAEERAIATMRTIVSY